jgi:hypothetical protein
VASWLLQVLMPDGQNYKLDFEIKANKLSLPCPSPPQETEKQQSFLIPPVRQMVFRLFSNTKKDFEPLFRRTSHCF